MKKMTTITDNSILSSGINSKITEVTNRLVRLIEGTIQVASDLHQDQVTEQHQSTSYKS